MDYETQQSKQTRLIRELRQAMERQLLTMDADDVSVLRTSIQRVEEHLDTWESLFVGSHITALLIHDPSNGQHRPVVNGWGTSPPFRDADRLLFELLLTKARQRVSDPDDVTRMLEAMLTLFANVCAGMAEQTGTSPLVAYRQTNKE